MGSTDLVDRARTACTECAWTEAYEAFTEADRTTTLEPTDLERLATAAYLTGHDDECAEAWSRAHRAWHERGDVPRAVRCAFWLGFALVQRGDMSQGGGWLARAGRLVEEHALDTVERGYLLVPEGLMAMGAGEADAALDRFAQADSLARRFDDRDLAALGRLGQGEALLHMGRTSAGVRMFDEAMVAVLAGETSPVISGLVYCAVIERCQRFFDLRRAHEWTAALDRWCARQEGLVPYRGQCLVHRSQVMQICGEWDAALVEVERAVRWLRDPPHPALGTAHYQRGELHRLRGEMRRAEEAYRLAHAAGRDPQPGLALLRLAQGRVDAAVAAIESALEGADAMARARLLPAYVRIVLAAGRTGEARVAADELDGLAAGESEGMLAAIAAATRGALLLATGEPRAAVGRLRAALAAWQGLEAPYETAEIRVLLAAACRSLGDRDRAGLESEAARAAFVGLGAAPALADLERQLAGDEPDELADDAGRGSTGAPAVTDRQREVLALVAAGRTNRQIADELAISVKTVERHLGNIFTALGVANRAAATARAYELGLL